MELTGKIKAIFQTQTFNSGFQKREFVVATQEQYPQQIKFEFVKDKCSLLDKFSNGDEVKVFFDIKGREYQDKYFVNLQAWKMEKISSNTEATTETFSETPPPEISTGTDVPDDLPF